MIRPPHLTAESNGAPTFVQAKRTEQAVPKAEQGAEVAVVDGPFRTVVKAVQAWREDDCRQSLVEPWRKGNVGMFPNRRGQQDRLFRSHYGHRSAHRENDANRHRDGHDKFQRVVPETCRYVDGGIGMMHAMDTPKQTIPVQ